MSVEFVAELSANHLRSLDTAHRWVEAAAYAGADAVKFQTLLPEEMAPPGVKLDRGPWAGRDLRDLYAETYLPWDWHLDLAIHAMELGLDWFSSPFSPTAVKFLEALECPRYKIASPELGYTDLLQAVSATGKPIVMSTGMATEDEITQALWQLDEDLQLTLLHCLSAYPAEPEDFNLRTMVHMRQRFGEMVGLSSHSLSIQPALTAIALGAILIEQHLTLDRAHGGPDAAFSLMPHEFKALIEQGRQVVASLGKVQYGPRPAEADSTQYRRSLWVNENLKTGQTLLAKHLSWWRPARGISDPEPWVGQQLKCDVPAGTPLSPELFQT